MTWKVLTQALCFTCLASPLWAQTAAPTPGPAAPAAESADLGEILVTGSRIRRAVQDSPLPLQVFVPDDLKRESINSPEQFIMNLTSNGTGLDNLASNADVVAGQARGNNGASSANLRGQGAAATLILLNGRRVAAHGLNGGVVDINQIPLAAVERIEVLKDGASAIYGTDAVGGVINFITRQNYTGLNAQGFIDKTQDGGGDIYRASMTGGFGDLQSDGFNVMAAISFSSHKELRGSQRDFVDTFQVERGLSVDTRGTPFATIFPLNSIASVAPNGTLFGPTSGTLTAPFVPGSTTVRANGGVNPLNLPGGQGCDAIDGMEAYDSLLWDNPSARFACAWDTGQAAVLQQPLQTISYLARGALALGDHQVSLEFTGSHADSAKKFSNLQITPNTTTQAYVYPRNANTAAVYDRVFNQLVAVFPSLEARRGLPMAYRWRCIECGRREIETTTKTFRAFLGVDGPIGNNWDYQAGASYASSTADSVLGGGYYYRNTTRDAQGNIIANGIIDALNTGLINPFLLPGETQSDAALALLEGASARGVTLYGGKFSLMQIDTSVSGSLFSLPAGDVKVALGADYRREEYRFNGDARAASARPVIIAAPFDDANALQPVNRDIKALYAELLVPLFTGFELSAAVRRDDYDGFGSTTNPKISAKYRPIQQVMFRGSYNTGFRVPGFNQIFNGTIESLYSGRDLADPGRCPGGRPDSTIAACAVVQPIIVNGGKRDLGPETSKQFSFGVVIEPTDNLFVSVDWWRIKRGNTIQVLTLQQLVANASLFPERFLRDAGGNLVAIDQRWVNTGGQLTEGIELTVRGNGTIGAGSWSAGVDGTYLLKKKSRLIDTAPYGASEVGVFTFSGDLGLRWKHNAYFTYTQGPWSASISQLFRLGYRNQELPGVTAGRVSPPELDKRTSNYVIYNLSASYEATERFKITGGIKNLFNTDPPFAISYDSSTGGGSSWEPRVADPRGRSFTLLLEYAL